MEQLNVNQKKISWYGIRCINCRFFENMVASKGVIRCGDRVITTGEKVIRELERIFNAGSSFN